MLITGKIVLSEDEVYDEIYSWMENQGLLPNKYYRNVIVHELTTTPGGAEAIKELTVKYTYCEKE